MTCKNCGSKNKDNAKYCTNCGEPTGLEDHYITLLQPIIIESTKTESSSLKKNILISMLSVCITVIIVLCIVLFVDENESISIKDRNENSDNTIVYQDDVVKRNNNNNASAGNAHIHDYGDWFVVDEATCTQNGSKKRLCKVCQTGFELEVVFASGHRYGQPVIVPVSCFTDGSETKTCADCGHTETKTINQIGFHDYSDWATTKEANCDHDGEQTKTCAVCGATETQIIDKVGEHQYFKWETTKTATCGTNGEKTQTCTICGNKNTQIIYANGSHSYSGWQTVGSTSCTEPQQQKRTCSICGDTQTQTTREGGMHEWAPGTKHCRKCGQQIIF